MMRPTAVSARVQRECYVSKRWMRLRHNAKMRL